jgi:hypothetical protein
MMSKVLGQGRSRSKSGAATKKAARELTTPSVSAQALRPAKTTTGLDGEATSKGSVPARLSQVVPATAKRLPIAASMTAFSDEQVLEPLLGAEEATDQPEEDDLEQNTDVPPGPRPHAVVLA